MAHYSIFLTIIVAVLSTICVQCTEFVPVYMWGTEKTSEHVPALHKISEDSFKDTFLEILRKDPFIIVFAERTLSPEDFAQHDPRGHSAFKNIQELKNQGNYISYRPYVQNPIGAIKQVDRPIKQTSVKSILTSVDVPEDNIWIIDLDDAKEDETRFHMLRRHDSDIISIYQDAVKKHDNVLAIYTANHTAWVAPEDVSHSKRSLLATSAKDDSDTSVIFSASKFLLYLKEPGQIQEGDKIYSITNDTFALEVAGGDLNITATFTSTDMNFKLAFSSNNEYWNLYEAQVKNAKISLTDVYAPIGFSYHCTSYNLTFGSLTLYLPGLQMQPFINSSVEFGDYYDCVGFTSVPIWSGLFVTAILLIIITFGLTMMIDIKTMDRFDDPKGKTITITASE